MRVTRLIGPVAVVLLTSAGGLAFQFSNVSAAAATPRAHSTLAKPMVSHGKLLANNAPAPECNPRRAPMILAIAFTSNLRDSSALGLRLPWGHPGDQEGRMVEDYGSYNGDSIEEQFPVYDVTSGSLHVLSGHNAIDIVLQSGTPLYAVTSGTVFTNHDWTIPGFARGYAAILISDTLRDDSGHPVAFLYGHVREFDTANWQHVRAGALIAKSGGGPNDPGHGFSDMPNVHFEIIESAHPLAGRAGTVNPHRFLENLYAYAVPLALPAGCGPVA